MSSEDFTRLARNLKTARKARGISQARAGEEVSVSRQTIVNWENPENTAEPGTTELSVLAKLYGVTSKQLRFSELAPQPAAPVRPLIAEEPPGTIVLAGNAKRKGKSA